MVQECGALGDRHADERQLKCHPVATKERASFERPALLRC
jgi:hypothetical protein